MKKTRMTGDKREARQEMHLTRPPRMEGVVKEAMMQPKKKKKAAPKPKKKVAKTQASNTSAQRKQYQLKTPKPKRAAKRGKRR